VSGLNAAGHAVVWNWCEQIRARLTDAERVALAARAAEIERRIKAGESVADILDAVDDDLKEAS